MQIGKNALLQSINGKKSKVLQLIKVRDYNLLQLIYIVLLRITLELNYVYFLEDSPLYKEYYLNSHEIFYYILSWVLFLLMSAQVIYILNIKKKLSTSKIIILLLFCLSFIPTTIHYGLAGLSLNYLGVIILYWEALLISYYLMKDIVILPEKRINFNSRLTKVFRIIIVLFSVFVIMLSLYKVNDGILVTLKLQDVYKMRENASNSGISTILSIFLAWTGGVIIPAIAVFKLIEKKYIKFIGCLIIQLLSFFVAGMKSQLFIIPSAIALMIIIDNKKVNKIPIYLSALGLTSIAEYLLIGTFKLCDYIITRIFFIPALLNYNYYDFFTRNPKLFLSEDLIIERVITKILNLSKPYSQYSSLMIGQNYFGRDMYANNGTIGYAYADLGLVGVIGAAIVTVLIIKILDSIMKDYHIKYSSVAIIIFTLMLISVSVSTIVYQYFIPFILVTACFKGEKNYDIN